jgi:hypothetical protein
MAEKKGPLEGFAVLEGKTAALACQHRPLKLVFTCHCPLDNVLDNIEDK